MSAISFALSRTCNLRDFPECASVAVWQQRLAEEAWTRWLASTHVRSRDGGLVVNHNGNPFAAPGPAATYGAILRPVPADDHAALVPAVYGLGVLERSEAPVAFLSQARLVLRPQGLLFLTFAYWDAEGPDTAHGHEERRRIYSAHSYQRLIREARRVGFDNFGGTDWTYHGHVLGDHSLASLVLCKR